jgi:hypothetical protein
MLTGPFKIFNTRNKRIECLPRITWTHYLVGNLPVTSTGLRLGKRREDCLYYDDSKLRRERGSEGSLEIKYASAKHTGACDSVLAKPGQSERTVITVTLPVK